VENVHAREKARLEKEIRELEEEASDENATLEGEMAKKAAELEKKAQAKLQVRISNSIQCSCDTGRPKEAVYTRWCALLWRLSSTLTRLQTPLSPSLWIYVWQESREAMYAKLEGRRRKVAKELKEREEQLASELAELEGAEDERAADSAALEAALEARVEARRVEARAKGEARRAERAKAKASRTLDLSSPQPQPRETTQKIRFEPHGWWLPVACWRWLL